MRTLTLARMGRALLLAAAVIMLPQLASAQLPVESQAFKIQATSGSNSVTLDAPTVTTSYTLTYPGALGAGAGSFMFLKPVTGGSPIPGQMAWTNAPAPGETTLYWDGTDIKWVDPNAATNPNWSRSGNAVTAGTGKLGTTTLFGFNIVTNDVTRIALADNGNITISDSTDINGLVRINGTGSDATDIGTSATAGAVTIGGAGAQAIAIGNGAAEKTVTLGSTNTTSTTTINGGASGAVNIGAAAIGLTGATTQTGALALAGTTSPFVMGTDPGGSGEVLVSKGTGATPEWQNLNEAIGIRKAGRVPTGGTLAAPTAATSVNVTGVILQDTDAIIITVDGGGAAVVPNVSSRTHSTGAATTDGAFTVTLSSSYAGAINYMIIRNQ